MEEIEVSGKHLKLRIAAFVLAVIVGVSAFAVAFRQMANREPGYYEITATRDETAPLYPNGVSLYCYFSGTSSVIKEKLMRSEALYSESLARIYRLLEPRQTFDGYVNLATLNQRPGEAVALPAELFEVLMDVQARAEGLLSVPFDGALRGIWQELLYLSEPQAFDPLRDEGQRDRMEAVKAALSSPDAIRLEVVDPSTYTVRLEVSDALSAVLREYEVEAPLVDLGPLREAYTLRYVGNRLVKEGFLQGYLKTDSGLSLLLPETAEGQLILMGYADGQVRDAALTSLGNGAACCALRAFSLGDLGYYEIDGVLRHPNLDEEGEPNPRLLAVWTVSAEGDVVDAALKAAALFASPQELLRERLSAFGAEGVAAAVIQGDAPKTILTDPVHGDVFQPLTENGYALS